MKKVEAYIDGKGKIDKDKYFDILEEAGIINGEEDITDLGDGSYEIVAEDEYVFETTFEPNEEEAEDVKIEYVGKDDEPRITKITVERNAQGIEVTVETKNVEGGEYTYSYKKEGESEWTEAGRGSENRITINGIEEAGRYEIKVTIELEGEVIEKIVTVEIEEGEEVPEGAITFGEVNWIGDGTAEVEIQASSEATGYTIQYQKNTTEGQWQDIGSGEKITGLVHGETVYAKLTNGIDESEYITKQVTDDIPPEVSIQAGTPTSNSIQITVTATDGQSGLADTGTYQYYLGDDLKQTTETNTYNYTGLTQGTKYTLKVVVTDKAGKTTEKTTEITTASIPGGGTGEPGQEGAITFGSIQWSNNKASVQVSTNTSYTIEYQVNNTEAGNWITVSNNGTIENLNYNDTVYARLTDGSNVGENSTLVVTDDIPPEVSIQAGQPTSNSVQITVTASDAQSGLATSGTYQYYLGDELKATTETNTYNYTGLTQGTPYTLKVVVTDKAGKTTEKTTDITTASIPGGGTGEPGQGEAIEFGEVRWSNNKASMQVTTNTSYTIECQINGTEEGKWQEIASGETIGELQDGNVVNVRLTDGNNVGQMISKTIEDNIAPKVVVAGGGTTSNSIKVVATAEDAESGMISSPTYTYYIKESTEGEEGYEVASGATGIAENTYTFTGLKQGTSYDVKVEVNGDVAGNKGTGEIKGQTTASIPSGETGGVITFGNTAWSNNKASVQVSTTTSYQIEYQVNNTEEESWTTVANNGTIENLNYNDTVYARLTDGSNVGEYATLVITDDIPPEVEIQAGTPTSNSVQITVTAVDGQSGLADTGTYRYYLGEELKQTTETNTYTFAGLTQGTQYTLKVVVTDKAGKTTEKTTNITTLSIPAGTGAITFTNPTWSSNKASVQVNTNAGYQIEYQVNSTSGSWTKIASGGTIGNLNHNDNVYARLTDGNNVGSHATCAIKDEIAPTVSISTSNLTYNSATLTATATDAQSGIKNYQFYLGDTLKTTQVGNSYTYTGLAENTPYTLKVIVTDNAGNTKDASTSIKTGISNAAPQMASVTFSAKTTNSLTIKARATDGNSSDRLTYTLYTSTSNTGGFTNKATLSNQTPGAEVTLTASGLSQYTEYYYYVTVSDGKSTNQSATQDRVRTYCPGNTLYCRGGTRCPGPSTTTCTVCNGLGSWFQCTDMSCPAWRK